MCALTHCLTNPRKTTNRFLLINKNDIRLVMYYTYFRYLPTKLVNFTNIG